MNRYVHAPSTTDVVILTSYFSKTSERFKHTTQNSFNGDDLQSAMAIFPEFFYLCDIRHRNVQRERTSGESATESNPRGIEDWYKSEFGIKKPNIRV